MMEVIVSDFFQSESIACTVYLKLRWDLLFSIMILIALMWAWIPSGPDNFEKVIEY